VNKLQKIICFALIFCFLLLCGCEDNNIHSVYSKEITDSEGNTVKIAEAKNLKVVSCHASLTECFILAGGKPVGVTRDVIEERHLLAAEDAEIIGDVKNINLETLISLEPDFVILSSDIATHKKLAENLEQLSVPYGFFREDTFEDYMFVMQGFCNLTGRDDLFLKNVTEVEKRIKQITSKIPENSEKTAILARTFSTGIKAKTDDNPAGVILKDLKVKNLAEDYPSSLESLSLEALIKCNPDFILTYPMGDEKAAKSYLNSTLESSPAFNSLSAVKTGNYHLLPKQLFQYKPNNRWDESYEYLAKIIYPEIFK